MTIRYPEPARSWIQYPVDIRLISGWYPVDIRYPVNLWSGRVLLGMEQVVSSIPGSVRYISHVYWAYDYLGPFGVL